MNRLVVTLRIQPNHLDQIRRQAPEFDVCAVDPQDTETLREVIEDAVIWFGPGLTADLFSQAKRLQWIQTGSAGVDHLMWPELIESEVIVTNVRGMHADPVADHVLMVMLALSRNLPAYVRQQQDGLWQKQPAAELTGDTVALVGLGAIGQAIARRAAAFGMRVVGIRRSAGAVPGIDEIHTPDRKIQVFRESRWVVLACPLTQETKNFIGEKELEAIGPKGFLINIGRGPLVDEAALITALRDERIAGAALDVFTCEPLPPDHPFWHLKHCLITPHAAGKQRDYPGQATEMFLENLRRFRQKQPLYRQVDKRKGY